eukprot:jgi/Bigna1/88241/estExt_fgenesh1_pg.C_290152
MTEGLHHRSALSSLLLLLLCCLQTFCLPLGKKIRGDVQRRNRFLRGGWVARVVEVVDHSEGRFTEGLTLDSENGMLIESTGRKNHSCIFSSPIRQHQSTHKHHRLNSQLHREAITTNASARQEEGSRVLKTCLNSGEFGEGITVLGDRVYQLTYKARVVHAYERKSLEAVETLPLPASGPEEGWGLTSDGQTLFISDGTDTLHLLDDRLRPLGVLRTSNPNPPPPPRNRTQQPKQRLENHGAGSAFLPPPSSSASLSSSSSPTPLLPPLRLNELEFVPGNVTGITENDPNGLIFANLLMSSRCLAAISPDTGHVKGYTVLPESLYKDNPNPLWMMLNGIAYDSSSSRFLLTGKNWPKMFWVELSWNENVDVSVCFRHYVESLTAYPVSSTSSDFLGRVPQDLTVVGSSRDDGETNGIGALPGRNPRMLERLPAKISSKLQHQILDMRAWFHSLTPAYMQAAAVQL